MNKNHLSQALLPCHSAFFGSNRPAPPCTALLQYFLGCFCVRCRSPHHKPWTCVLNLNWARKKGSVWTDDKHWLFYHPTFEKLTRTLVTLNIFNSKEQKLISSTIKILHSLIDSITILEETQYINEFYSSHSLKGAFVLSKQRHYILKIHF